jgi:AcrR family transcriptional regulator
MRPQRVTRDGIIAATMRLLQSRDAEFVTVAVIGKTAGASRTTFYRYFSNQQEAIDAALARICDDMVRALPSIENAPLTLQGARVQLRRWCEELAANIGRDRALRRALLQAPSAKLRARIRRSLMTEDVVVYLGRFLERLKLAGFVDIEDAAATARSIKGIIVAAQLAATLLPAGHDIILPGFEEVYTLVERAIFGAHRLTAHEPR